MITEILKVWLILQMGHFMSNFSTFLVAIIVAFACCWEVGLLSLLVVPMLLMVGASYSKAMISMSLARTSFVSEATAIVEQVPVQMNAMLKLSRFKLNFLIVCELLFVHRTLHI